jgi:hypothetical protein
MQQQLMGETKGFFRTLFDFSFKVYVTPKILKILFGIVIVLSALSALFLIAVSFKVNAAAGIFVLLIVAPLVFLLNVILYRIILEIIMTWFNLVDSTGTIARSTVHIADSTVVGPTMANEVATRSLVPPTEFFATPSTVRCSSCGSTEPTASGFCGNCGSRLPDLEPR